MSRISAEAIRKKQRVIVLRKNTPVFALIPLSPKDIVLWKFNHDIEEAKQSVRTGKTYSTAEVRRLLGFSSYEV